MEMKQIETKELFEKINKDELLSKGKLRVPSEIKDVFYHKTCLRHSRSYPKDNLFYLYHKGVYISLSPGELLLMVCRLLELSGISIPMTFQKQIVEILRINLNAYRGDPQEDKDHIVFNNGVLNHKTGTFYEWTPDIFILRNRINDEWAQDYKEPTHFMKFLHSFCDGEKDRMDFLRAVSWATLTGRNSAQIFVVLVGRGATGKSTWCNLMEAIVGRDACISTCIRELNRNAFETSFLKGKKIIFFNDIEVARNDYWTSILKQLTGGDPVRAREKYSMNSGDFRNNGMIIIATNEPLFLNDSGDSLARRVRHFPADNEIPLEERKMLLVYNEDYGTYEGPLNSELKYIRKWAYDADKALGGKALEYLALTNKMVPSFMKADISIEVQNRMDHMVEWIKEELTEGAGLYLGYRLPGMDAKSKLETSRRKLLYPTYVEWCKKRGIREVSHRVFAYDLINKLLPMYKSKKIRRNEGTFITGIDIKPHVYNHDNIYGGPLNDNYHLNPEGSHTGYNPPLKGKQHHSLIPNLYEEYHKLLEKTPLKIELNKHSKEMKIDIDKLINIYLSDKYNPSDEFIGNVRNVLSKGIVQVQKFGAIPYKYRLMGLSPRIIPITYGDSINNCKQILRREIYQHLGTKLIPHDKVILDIDLKSCYTSILLGLYPKPLEAIQIAIEGSGLWDYIKEEFKRNGRENDFKKAPVKICVYSSLFGGGNNAMIGGIMEMYRKDLGVTHQEFKKLSDYNNLYDESQKIADMMQHSGVITDFRAISQQVKETYMNETLIGPSGHYYEVNEADFYKSYPNWLQSFEFSLLVDSTIKVMKKYEDTELLGHYHDGNVLCVTRNRLESFMSDLSGILEEVGHKLGLRYTQKFEIKNIYPGI